MFEMLFFLDLKKLDYFVAAYVLIQKSEFWETFLQFLVHLIDKLFFSSNLISLQTRVGFY